MDRRIKLKFTSPERERDLYERCDQLGVSIQALQRHIQENFILCEPDARGVSPAQLDTGCFLVNPSDRLDRSAKHGYGSTRLKPRSSPWRFSSTSAYCEPPNPPTLKRHGEELFAGLSDPIWIS